MPIFLTVARTMVAYALRLFIDGDRFLALKLPHSSKVRPYSMDVVAATKESGSLVATH